MIVARYEKGIKFLDLEKFEQRSMDGDGTIAWDICWACSIYENGANPDEHQYIEFGNETLARMFIAQNEWKEQVI